MLSMTGYGQAVRERDGRELAVEVRCVNHRYLDLNIRAPRAVSFLEDRVRALAAQRLERGHADITVTYRNKREDAVVIEVDEGLARSYRDALRRLNEVLDTPEGQTMPGPAFYAGLPGVLKETPRAEDQDALRALLEEALSDAFDQVAAMRAREGARLKADLACHADALSALRKKISAQAGELPGLYRAQLTERLRQLDVTVDPQRLAQEVALFADRAAIDEELARLSSHLLQLAAMAEEEGALGKKMDFIIQEMNREANTIASKSPALSVTDLAVQCKNEIEKLREQVQNVL